MPNDLFSERLQHLKRNENPEAVLFVADDPELMKIVVAWTTLDVRPAEKPTDPPDERDRSAGIGSGQMSRTPLRISPKRAAWRPRASNGCSDRSSAIEYSILMAR